MITLYTTIAAILLFALLIFIHELGHFAAAKACGIRVIEFSLGMGPAIFKKQKGETTYSIRCLPIGGFCKMDGEDEESDDPKAFYKQKWWKRIIVLAAGGIMNLLAGLIVWTVIISMSPMIDVPKVDALIPGGAAETAGILPGDVIYKIDNTRINMQNDVHYSMYRKEGNPVNITVVREGEKKTFLLTPQYNKGEQRYMIGYMGSAVENNFLLTIQHGYYETVFFSKTILNTLGDLLIGKIGMSNLSGPIGIISEVGGAVNKAAQEDPSQAAEGRANIVLLFLLITINLGLFNLLPFPALDGGRMVFVIVEAIRKKALPPEREGLVHLIGFGLLMMLMIFATSQDIWRLFNR